MKLTAPLIDGWNPKLINKRVKIFDNKDRFIDVGIVQGYYKNNLRSLRVLTDGGSKLKETGALMSMREVNFCVFVFR